MKNTPFDSIKHFNYLYCGWAKNLSPSGNPTNNTEFTKPKPYCFH